MYSISDICKQILLVFFIFAAASIYYNLSISCLLLNYIAFLQGWHDISSIASVILTTKHSTSLWIDTHWEGDVHKFLYCHSDSELTEGQLD